MEYEELVELLANESVEQYKRALDDAKYVAGKLESIDPKKAVKTLALQNVKQDKAKDAELDRKEAQEKAA